MCREILSTCIRNTEVAEEHLKHGNNLNNNSNAPPTPVGVPGSTLTGGSASSAVVDIGGGGSRISLAGSVTGRGLGKGIWAMIEESELAKTIRQGEGRKVCFFFL